MGRARRAIREMEGCSRSGSGVGLVGVLGFLSAPSLHGAPCGPAVRGDGPKGARIPGPPPACASQNAVQAPGRLRDGAPWEPGLRGAGIGKGAGERAPKGPGIAGHAETARRTSPRAARAANGVIGGRGAFEPGRRAGSSAYPAPERRVERARLRPVRASGRTRASPRHERRPHARPSPASGHRPALGKGLCGEPPGFRAGLRAPAGARRSGSGSRAAWRAARKGVGRSSVPRPAHRRPRRSRANALRGGTARRPPRSAGSGSCP